MKIKYVFAIILFCITCFQVNKATSQTNVYHPLVQDTVTLTYVFEHYPGGQAWSEYSGSGWIICQDTFVTYTNTAYKLLRYGVVWPLLGNSSSIGYLIREDNKKVYWRSCSNYPGDTSEYPLWYKDQILYDFSLAVGDTFTFQKDEGANQIGQGLHTVLENTDSILLRDGTYRKRFLLHALDYFYSSGPSGWEYYDSWIEGVGSIRDLDYTSYVNSFGDGGQVSLYSYHIDTTLLWGPDTAKYFIQDGFNLNEYWFNITGLKKPKGEKNNFISLIPNPVKKGQLLVLNIPDESIDEITIISVNGKTLEVVKTEKNELILPDTINEGVYTIKIKTKSKKEYHEKLIVQ